MQKPAILITGAHRARDLSTVSMSVYTVVRTLYGYVKNDSNITYLLNNTAMVVIPAINVDGYNFISSYYNSTGNFSYIRKNLHTYTN